MLLGIEWSQYNVQKLKENQNWVSLINATRRTVGPIMTHLVPGKRTHALHRMIISVWICWEANESVIGSGDALIIINWKQTVRRETQLVIALELGTDLAIDRVPVMATALNERAISDMSPHILPAAFIVANRKLITLAVHSTHRTRLEIGKLWRLFKWCSRLKWKKLQDAPTWTRPSLRNARGGTPLDKASIRDHVQTTD